MKTLTSAGAVSRVIGIWLVLLCPLIARAQTSNTCISPLSSDFYTKYELLTLVTYVETNASGPVLDGTNAFEFAAAIILATNLQGTASSAVLTVPGQPPTVMATNRSLSNFVVGILTNAFTNITSSFPDGTYQFNIFENTVLVTLPDGSTLPNAPTLSNYAADQAINASQDFMLRWNPFIIGGVVDGITVSVTSEYDGSTVFKSGDYGCPEALNGTATSVLIPSNTLATNTTYRVQIGFIKAYTFDTNMSPGNALLAATEATTDATIATGPVAVTGPAPVLANAAALPGGSVRFDVMTTPGATYTIQFNQDLNNPMGWMTLLTTDAVGTLVAFTNSPPAGGAPSFYRAMQQ